MQGKRSRPSVKNQAIHWKRWCEVDHLLHVFCVWLPRTSTSLHQVYQAAASNFPGACSEDSHLSFVYWLQTTAFLTSSCFACHMQAVHSWKPVETASLFALILSCSCKHTAHVALRSGSWQLRLDYLYLSKLSVLAQCSYQLGKGQVKPKLDICKWTDYQETREKPPDQAVLRPDPWGLGSSRTDLKRSKSALLQDLQDALPCGDCAVPQHAAAIGRRSVTGGDWSDLCRLDWHHWSTTARVWPGEELSNSTIKSWFPSIVDLLLYSLFHWNW